MKESFWLVGEWRERSQRAGWPQWLPPRLAFLSLKAHRYVCDKGLRQGNIPTTQIGLPYVSFAELIKNSGTALWINVLFRLPYHSNLTHQHSVVTAIMNVAVNLVIKDNYKSNQTRTFTGLWPPKCPIHNKEDIQAQPPS